MTPPYRDDIRQLHHEARRQAGPAAVTLIVVAAAALIATLTIGAMWLFGVGWFDRATANYRGEGEQIERTRADGDYRIAAYDRFFDLCSTIQSKEDQIIQQTELLEMTEDSQQKMQIRANLAALEASRSSLIWQYNADAQKEGTRGQFRDSDLPHQINIDNLETSCTGD